MKKNSLFSILTLILVFSLFQPVAGVQAAGTQAVNSPASCAYGYTLDDTVNYDTYWQPIDFTGTTLQFSSPVADESVAGPLELGFTFPYFENSFSSIYVSTNGFITLTEPTSAYSKNTPLPIDTAPANIIAPFWDDLVIGKYSDSSVKYELVGTAPDRAMIIEWIRATRDGDDLHPITFELVLHENGDFQFIYANLQGTLNQATVGFSDSSRLDGIQYVFNADGLASPRAVAITRPLPGPSVRAYPIKQGRFVTRGRTSFTFSVVNTGSTDDTFNIESAVAAGSPGWLTLFLAPDGQPLPDTNLDGLPDTGILQPGQETSVRVAINAPPNAVNGDYNQLIVSAVSTLDPGKIFSIQILAARPAPFVQLFSGTGIGINQLVVTPDHFFSVSALDFFTGSSMSLVETSAFNYITAWEKVGVLNGRYFINIEYMHYNARAYHDPNHYTVDDNSAKPYPTWDVLPVSASDGRGTSVMAFIREKYDETWRENSNIMLSLMGKNGKPQSTLLNLTNNDGWAYSSSTLNVPLFKGVSVASTPDHHWVITWSTTEKIDASTTAVDVYMTILDEALQTILPVTRVTDSALTHLSYQNPLLHALSDGRYLLTYEVVYPAADVNQLSYAVYNSDGSKTSVAAEMGGTNVKSVDTVQLQNENIMIVWVDYRTSQVSYMVLSPTGSVIHPPSAMAFDPHEMGAISVTSDLVGRAILTWRSTDKSTTLYYALLDSSGNVVTPPMPFITGDYINSSTLLTLGTYSNAALPTPLQPAQFMPLMR